MANISMSSIFLEETKRLLKERPKHITLSLISEETGLTTDWLESLRYKKDCNPGVIAIETLFNYLATEPITIFPEKQAVELIEE